LQEHPQPSTGLGRPSIRPQRGERGIDDEKQNLDDAGIDDHKDRGRD